MLQKEMEDVLMFHNLYETFPSDHTEAYTGKNQKIVKDLVARRTSEINERIRFMNQGIRFTEKKERVSLVSRKILLNLVKDRFTVVYKSEESQKLANENLKIKINNHLSLVKKSVMDLVQSVDDDNKDIDFSGINEEYWEELNEARDMYSVGYHRTSVFVLGRTIERTTNDIFKLLIRKRIKSVKEIPDKFDAKIGILKSKEIIDEKLFHELSTLKIDRNDTGHPVVRSISREENELILKKTVLLLKKLQKVLLKYS